MLKMRVINMKEYYCQLYKRKYYIFRGVSRSHFSYFMKDRFELEVNVYSNDGYCAEICDVDGYCFTVIWVRYKKMIPELVHELTHATMNLFDFTGIKYSSDNSEQFTYYLENLLRISLASED